MCKCLQWHLAPQSTQYQSYQRQSKNEQFKRVFHFLPLNNIIEFCLELLRIYHIYEVWHCRQNEQKKREAKSDEIKMRRSQLSGCFEKADEVKFVRNLSSCSTDSHCLFAMCNYSFQYYLYIYRYYVSDLHIETNTQFLSYSV